MNKIFGKNKPVIILFLNKQNSKIENDFYSVALDTIKDKEIFFALHI